MSIYTEPIMQANAGNENNLNLALNCISSCEAEKLFATMEHADLIPFPFHIMWLIKTVELFIERDDANGLSVIFISLYEALEMDVPDILPIIEKNGLLIQFAGEFISDLAEIAVEEYSRP